MLAVGKQAKAENARGLTDGSQNHEADAVCRHRFLGANLGLVEPEKRVYVGGCMSDGGPAEEETSEYEEAKYVSADRLWNCQFEACHFSRGSTHKWSFDAVEPEYLNGHED
jgi:hypothetical protein